MKQDLPRILIVDDTPDIAKMLCLHLDGIVYCDPDKDLAYDTRDALVKYEAAKLSNNPYKLIFTDVAMPGMTGFEMAREVRARGDWTTPIAFHTAYNKYHGAVEAAYSVGSNIILTKPIDRSELRDKVLLAMSTPPFKPNEGNEIPPLIFTEKSEPSPALETDPVARALSPRRSRLDVFSPRIMVPLLLANAAFLAIVIALQLSTAVRAPITAKGIIALNRKMDGAITVEKLPNAHLVVVPDTKGALTELKRTGKVRLTLEFSPESADAARSIALQRNTPLYVQFIRRKGDVQ